jgi:hypothetical protein
MKIKIYKYIDGNGNEFIIENEPTMSIEYNPVKPLYSSSGFYNGGEHMKKEITKRQFQDLVTLFKQISTKKEIQMKDRVKLSSLIVIQENHKQFKFIIKPYSKEIDIIEENLKEIIEN